jgi:uncharacterized protein (DUF427 family)
MLWQKQYGKARSSPNQSNPWKWKATNIFHRTPSNRNISDPARPQSVCPWKGTASYYDLEVNGEPNQGAAWHRPQPKPAASQIKRFGAFSKGVTVEK